MIRASTAIRSAENIHVSGHRPRTRELEAIDVSAHERINSNGSRERLVLLAHDSVDELVLVEHAIAILISPVHHLLELVVGHVLAELLADALQVLEGDGAGLVVVEELEDLEEVLAGVLTLLASGHHGQELVEVDGTVTVGVDVVDELADLVGLSIHAEGLHG